MSTGTVKTVSRKAGMVAQVPYGTAASTWTGRNGGRRCDGLQNFSHVHNCLLIITSSLIISISAFSLRWPLLPVGRRTRLRRPRAAHRVTFFPTKSPKYVSARRFPLKLKITNSKCKNLKHVAALFRPSREGRIDNPISFTSLLLDGLHSHLLGVGGFSSDPSCHSAQQAILQDCRERAWP